MMASVVVSVSAFRLRNPIGAPPFLLSFSAAFLKSEVILNSREHKDCTRSSSLTLKQIGPETRSPQGAEGRGWLQTFLVAA